MQFLLLSATVLHWCDEWSEARQTLDLAIGKTLQLDINMREFTDLHGEGLRSQRSIGDERGGCSMQRTPTLQSFITRRASGYETSSQRLIYLVKKSNTNLG